MSANAVGIAVSSQTKRCMHQRRKKMADLEKSKTPFEDFIKSLDKMNGLENKLVVPSNKFVIDELIRLYGLPEDADCVTLMRLVENQWRVLSKHEFPAMINAYIKILMWQVCIDNKQPLNACLQAFLWGMSFGQVTDVELP